MGKRIGSLVLSLVMLISLWPCEASAEELQTGAGTVPSSEYEVARGLCSDTVVWLLTSKNQDLTAPYTLYLAPRADTDGNPVDGSEKLTVKEDANGIVSVGNSTPWDKTWNKGVETIIVAGGHYPDR